DEPPTIPDSLLTRDEQLAKARALLAEAGFGPDNPLSFTLTFRNASDRRIVIVALQDMWRQIGVDVKLQGQEVKVAYNSFRSGDFEAGDAGWVADYSDPDNFLFLVLTSSGQMNYGNYSNPKFDNLMAQASQMTDLAERAETLAAAERIILADLPLIPIYFGVNRNLVGPHVEGWVDNPVSIHRTRFLRLNESKRS
ncbi:MAG: ABC transporter substrate-binding protein, partial [Pseudomonadota bacterium]